MGIKLLLMALCIVNVGGERVKQKIYDNIQSEMACFKRFNGTHEIGCTSKFGGNIGVIHLISERSDLDWVFKNGTHSPYILALTPEFLSTKVLNEVKDSGKVSGLVVLVPEDYNPSSTLPQGFSGESECPNEQLGLYNESSSPEYAQYCSKNPWNPFGSGLLFESWDFPIFLIDNQTSVDNIVDCYKEFNKPINGEPRSWPLCAMELQSNMFGTTNTEVCQRRLRLSQFLGPVNFCDPLSDYNIWGTVKPMNRSEDLPPKSVIVVAARMDATSMFDNISPGAESAVSSLVTLLSTAEALYKYREKIMESGNAKNVLFVVYQGETWGYIGSSRMVWDMEKGEFPYKEQPDIPDQLSQINFTHIDYFIEISQVGKMMDNQLYLHTDPISNSDTEIEEDTKQLLTAFNMVANRTSKIKFQEVDPKMPLPPASFQSFLKRVNISGLVIADHEQEFKNKYYQSVFDDAQNIKEENITDVASMLATTLYLLLTAKLEAISADKELTENLLYCYSKNVSCQMFRDFGGRIPSTSEFYNEKPAKMYVSVKGGETSRTIITSNIFASLLGEKVEKNKTECKADSPYDVNQFYYFSTVDNGTCYQSTVRMTEALSPAFSIDGYDWQSGQYSTWTESGWNEPKATLFLRPSVVEEALLVCGGVAATVLSFSVVYFMNSRADLLFGLTNQPAAC